MPLQKYGIFSPTMGLKEDFPSILLHEANMPDNQNAHVRWGEVHACKMRNVALARVLISGASYNPILKYHWFKKTDGNNYLFAFTKDEIYKWSGSAWITWSSGVGVGGEDDLSAVATHWSVATYGNKVIATNGINVVLVGDDGTQFTELGFEDGGIVYAVGKYCSNAQWLAVFENYLILGNVTDDGTVYPQRIRWCDISDQTTWDSGDADYADLGGADHITGFGQYRDFLIIFKDSSYHRLWLATNELIFGTAVMSREIGCQAGDSIVNAKNGDLYFMASDKTIREIQFGEVSQAIDPSLKNMPDSLISRIAGASILPYGELWWSVPDGPGAANNNRVLTYKPDTKTWGDRDIEVSAFGNWNALTAAAFTWDTLYPTYKTWNEWGWEHWDTIEGLVGFEEDIGSDYSGYSYTLHNSTLDNGTAFTSFFVLSTDLAEKKAISTYKRLISMKLYFRKQMNGTVAVTYKRDTESAWQTLSTVNLDDQSSNAIQTITVPCDIRAMNYQFKFSATQPYNFLGVAFSYVMVGDR